MNTLINIILATIWFAFILISVPANAIEIDRLQNSQIPNSEMLYDIGLDTLQQYIIQSELEECNSCNIQSSLNGCEDICFHAFYAWVKRYIDNDSLTFTVLDLCVIDNLRNESPMSSWAEEEFIKLYGDDDSKMIDEIEVEKADFYFEQYPFKMVKPYGCCNLKKVLSTNNGMVCIKMNKYGVLDDASVVINSLIPLKDDPTEWKKIVFRYSFRWKIKVSYETLMETVKKEPFRYLDKDGFLKLENRVSSDFELKLYDIFLATNETLNAEQLSVISDFEAVFK